MPAAKPRTLVTSDLHLGHRGILAYHPARQLIVPPGRDPHEALLDRVLEQVGRGDELWHLGDLTLCGRPDRRAYLRRILAGGVRLRLIPGNHDDPRLDTRRLVEDVECSRVLCGAEPDAVSVLPPIHVEARQGTRVVMCHYPLEVWPGMEHRPDQGAGPAASDSAGAESWGWVHLHGHSHGRGRRCPDRLDVGWDAHGRVLELAEAVRLARAAAPLA